MFKSKKLRPPVFITQVLLFKIKPHFGLKLQENRNREGRKAIFSMCLYFVPRGVAWVNAVDSKSVNIVKHACKTLEWKTQANVS